MLRALAAGCALRTPGRDAAGLAAGLCAGRTAGATFRVCAEAAGEPPMIGPFFIGATASAVPAAAIPAARSAHLHLL